MIHIWVEIPVPAHRDVECAEIIVEDRRLGWLWVFKWTKGVFPSPPITGAISKSIVEPPFTFAANPPFFPEIVIFASRMASIFPQSAHKARTNRSAANLWAESGASM
jgi:hypothetical protein